MLQKTTDELLGGHSAIPGLSCVGGRVAKSDLTILQLQDATVTDSHPKDVGSQILQSCHPIAHGLAMNNPVLSPGFARHQGKQVCLYQSITKLGSKQDRERFDRHQEIFLDREPALAILRQAAGGHQIVHVGMIVQVSVQS